MSTPIAAAAEAAASLDNGGDSKADEDQIGKTATTGPTLPEAAPLDTFLSAQMRFVRAQTAFIHDNTQIAAMCTAQESYIYALQDLLHELGVF